jgi:hypothetical protein
MVIDLSPLVRGERGEAIRVAGVRVGDAAAGVERRALTGAEEDAPGERIYRDGSVYRRTPAGTFVEVPLAERVEATLQRGGFLRCGEIALRVGGGVIERIFVRGPSLASLGIAREEDIAARFGPATGREHSTLGWRVHHYPDRGLAIAWHEREGRVEHVQLGATWREPRLGAKELFSEVLSGFDVLSGDAEPPEGSARVRHRRVAALSRALGLGGVADLLGGRFLGGELHPARRAVLAEVAARGPLRDRPLRDRSASDLFTHLLQYRRDVNRVVCATSGWLECGDRVLLGMIATQNELGARIHAMMADIDRWLITLLDPEQRTFELRDLVARHGWPDVSLEALEMDEI